MIRVIKIGGRAQGDERLPRAIANAAQRDAVCVVHGGGDEVSDVQRQLGLTPRFHGGRRITTPNDIGVVRMVLSGTINKRLVAQFLSAGARAAGLSGEDGGLLLAHAYARPTLGEVGEPTRVDPAILRVLMANGFLPVVSPVGRDEETGATLNVNGDDAAAAIAVALGATELLLIADVPGVLRDGEAIAALDVDGIPGLLADGTARGGMTAKLEAARRALEGGVSVVRIGDLTAITDPARGTCITPTLSPSVL
jgi:acetylglutamate kinase